jgi:hypothetical protein
VSDNGHPPKDVHFRDVAPAIEFVCWVVVVVALLLRLINGAAVTSDQFIMLVTLFFVEAHQCNWPAIVSITETPKKCKNRRTTKTQKATKKVNI